VTTSTGQGARRTRAPETLPRSSERTVPWPRVPTATSRAFAGASEVAEPLGWIAGDEQRLDGHACCLGPLCRLAEGALGMAALGAQQVREQRRRRMNETEVALQGSPHGRDDHRVARRLCELERPLERCVGGYRSVRSDEDEPHARMLVMRLAGRIGADAAGSCGFPAAADA
jgi:hypothetical protein